jgi:hypothetical protein
MCARNTHDARAWFPRIGSLIKRLVSHLGTGLLVGAGAGALAGAAEMAVAGAITADRDALLAALLFAMYGSAFGMVFGAITGLALAMLMLPLTWRSRALRRLRLVWGLCAAAIVWGLCGVVFGMPTFEPGPNETIENVRSDLVWFYIAPSILALILATAFAPLLGRNLEWSERGTDAT